MSELRPLPRHRGRRVSGAKRSWALAPCSLQRWMLLQHRRAAGSRWHHKQQQRRRRVTASCERPWPHRPATSALPEATASWVRPSASSPWEAARPLGDFQTALVAAAAQTPEASAAGLLAPAASLLALAVTASVSASTAVTSALAVPAGPTATLEAAMIAIATVAAATQPPRLLSLRVRARIALAARMRHLADPAALLVVA